MDLARAKEAFDHPEWDLRAEAGRLQGLGLRRCRQLQSGQAQEERLQILPIPVYGHLAGARRH